MEIHFCDLCNESVPQADLDEGKAVLRNARVICSQCEHAMSGELGASPGAGAAPPPPPPGAGGGVPHAAKDPAAPFEGPVDPAAPAGAAPVPAATPSATMTSPGAAVAVVFSSIALLSTFGAAFYLYEHFGKLHVDQDSRISSSISKADLERGDTRILVRDKVDEAREELRDAHATLSALVAELGDASRDHANAVDDVREDLTRFADELTGLEEVRVEISAHGKQLNQMSGRASDLHNQILRVGDRLQELENRPVEVAVPTPVVPEEPSRPAWWSHVTELKSQNSGTRWQAVTALGDSGDPAVAEYLAPMLKDPDIFVRMATARVLGDLEAPIGIPALIDALEDPEASVREAAVVALRSVTGREHRFDPNAKESDRSKAVRRWRDWWDKAQDDFLGPAGS